MISNNIGNQRNVVHNHGAIQIRGGDDEAGGQGIHDENNYQESAKRSLSSSADETTNAIDLREESAFRSNEHEKKGIDKGTFLKTTKERSQHIGKQLGLQKLKSSIEMLKDQTSDFHQRIVQNHLDFDFSKVKVNKSQKQSDSLSNIVSPLLSFTASYFWVPTDNIPMTNLAVVTMTLLGSSLGFFSFLYFISLGYGLGVALPAIFALSSFNHLSKDPIPVLTNLHTINVVIWGVRLSLFLLHREYVNWKEWHFKLQEVDQRSKMSSKFSIWMSCTFFYASLFMPCLYRMRQATTKANNSNKITTSFIVNLLPEKWKSPYWGSIGILGIFFQILGIIFESIADYQKATFKAKKVVLNPKSPNEKITFPNRNKWCNVGLWKYSTHPNYFGEILFWIGTFVSGVGAMETFIQYTVGIIGLIGIFVIIFGATEQLDQKQYLQYKKNLDFVQFRKTVGFMGPKIIKKGTKKTRQKK